MKNEKINELKSLIKRILLTNSVKINKNGKIEIIFRFKPDIMKSYDDVNILEDRVLTKLNIITGIKYKILTVQKQPSLSYNIYARLLNSSSSGDRVKYYLKYFEKNNLNKFERTSYAEVYFTIAPILVEEFEQFLILEN